MIIYPKTVVLRLRKRDELIMADLGAAILLSVGRIKMSVSAMLALNINTLKSSLIIYVEINHTRDLKHLGKISRPKFGTNLHFRGLSFGEKNQINGT